MNSSLVTLIAKLPSRYYLKLRVELDDDGHPFLSGVIMEEPPEEGWTIPTYFNEPPGTPRAHTEEWLEPYRHDDKARVGVTADVNDHDLFERLLQQMLGWFLAENRII